MNRITLVLDALRGSYWFLPTVLTLAAAVLALGLVWADHALDPSTLRNVRWIYTGGAEGARELLATVAGAVVTVVGVAFSVTIVSLQLAAAQLGPRVLRNFMRDRGNQVVLGTFVATFVYCLLVLRTIRGDNGIADDTFTPHLAVTGGVALAMASAGVLIYFIHHAAVAIQADHVIATIATELAQTLDVIYPEQLGESDPAPDPAPALPARFEVDARPLHATGDGYVQSIGAEAVMRIAAEHDLLVRLECRPGDFVIAGEAVARAWPADRVDDATARALVGAVALGRVRTLMQDYGFGVEQLVEVAIRALSSNLRDPVTAMRCLDRLGAALAQLAGRRLPSPYRHDGGRLRLIAPGVSLAEITHEAFDAIRARGAESLAVTLRLLETIERIARMRPAREMHAALLRETVKIERGSRTTLTEPWERREIDLHAAAVRRALLPDVLAEAERVTLGRPA